MRRTEQEKRRETNVASRTLAEDLFYKFVACSEEDKQAFIARWNAFQSKAAKPRLLAPVASPRLLALKEK